MAAYVPKGLTGMKYTRTFAGGVVAQGTNDAGRSLQFNIGLMPAVLDLLEVYDFYRIDRVDVTFFYASEISATTSSASNYPTLAYCIDYDDDNAPSTLQDVLTSNLHKLHYFGEGARRTHTVSMVPRSNSIIARSTTTSVGLASQHPGTLIDAAYPDVQHYGLKYFLLNYNSAGFPNARVFINTRITATFFGARSG